MIPVYNIEDLTIEMVDDLIEKGVVFDVTSKASVLFADKRTAARDAFWSGRSGSSTDLRQTTFQQ